MHIMTDMIIKCYTEYGHLTYTIKCISGLKATLGTVIYVSIINESLASFDPAAQNSVSSNSAQNERIDIAKMF